MNSPFLLVVGLLACIVRFSITDVGDEHLLSIMSMVNIVALEYVIVILMQDAKHLVIDRLEKNNYPKESVNRNIKALNIFFCVFYFWGFVIITFVCFHFLHSPEGNDSISIMALVISICSAKLSEHIGNVIYDII